VLCGSRSAPGISLAGVEVAGLGGCCAVEQARGVVGAQADLAIDVVAVTMNSSVARSV